MKKTVFALFLILMSMNVIAITVPTFISYQGKLANANTGAPYTTASLNITIDEYGGDFSTPLWNSTFNNVADSQGVFDLVLGRYTQLNLQPGLNYYMKVEVDLGSATYVSADTIFGDNSPAGDLIIVGAGGPRNASELLISDGSASVQDSFVLKSGDAVSGPLNITGLFNVSGNITASALRNCDVLATDALGYIICDVDASGSSGVLNGSNNVNFTKLALGDATIPAGDGNINASGNLTLGGTTLISSGTGQFRIKNPANGDGQLILSALFASSSIYESSYYLTGYNVDNSFLKLSGGNVAGTATGANISLYGAQHSTNPSYLVIFANNTGIGLENPGEKLEVNGNTNISGMLNVSGNVSLHALASCDVLSTDANGFVICDVDATGSSFANNSDISVTNLNGSLFNLSGLSISSWSQVNYSDAAARGAVNQSGFFYQIQVLAANVLAGNFSGSYANLTDAPSGLIQNTTNFALNNGSISYNLSVGQNISISATSCDVLATDANGFVICDVDATGSSFVNNSDISVRNLNGSLFNLSGLSISSWSQVNYSDVAARGAVNQSGFLYQIQVLWANVMKSNTTGSYANLSDIPAGILQNSTNFVLNNGTITYNLSVGQNVSLPSKGCDVLSTDANGFVICDVDAGGSALNNGSNNVNFTKLALGTATLPTTDGSLNMSGNLTINGTNSRVGIGTNNPAYQLDVIGNVRFDNGSGDSLLYIGTNEFNLRESTGDGYLETTGMAIFLTDKDNDEINQDFIWGTDGTSAYTELMRLRDTGNLGIGLSNPGQKLEVNGNMNVSGMLNVSGNVSLKSLASCDVLATDANGFVICDVDAGGSALNNGSNNVNFTKLALGGATIPAGDGGLNMSGNLFAAGNARISNNFTVDQVLNITSGQAFVGMEDTTLGLVQIWGSDGGNGGSLRLWYGGNVDQAYQYWSLQLEDTASADEFYIGPNNNPLLLGIQSSGILNMNNTLNATYINSTQLYVTSSGTVLGQTNLAGGLNTSGNVSLRSITDCDVLATDANGFVICDVDATGTGLANGSNNVNFTKLALGEATLPTTDGSLNMSGNLTIVGTNQRVGIGTNSPVNLFQVVGDENITGTSYQQRTKGRYLDVRGDIDSPTIRAVEDSVAWKNLIFAATKLIIKAGDTSTETFNITASSGDINSSGSFQFLGSGKNYIAGSLGIGTINPGEKLQVEGNVNVSGMLNVSGNVSLKALASCDVLATDVNGFVICDVDAGGSALNNGSNNVNFTKLALGGARFPLTDGSLNMTGNLSVGTGTVFIDGTNSRLGVGTTTPTTELHVVGDANITGDDIWSTGTTLKIHSGNFNQLGLQIYTGGGTAAGVEAKHLCLRDSYACGATAAGQIISPQFNSTGTGTISMGANVGIGTTSPVSQLDVRGNVNLTGWVNATSFYGDGSQLSGINAAPTTADYLVGTANAGLSAEIVVGTSPGGELGGTWASPTLDDSVAVTSWSLTTPAIITSASVTDDDWIGLGSGAGRIEFDDQATDEVNILNAKVGIGTITPTHELNVVGDLNVSGGDIYGTGTTYIDIGEAYANRVTIGGTSMYSTGSMAYGAIGNMIIDAYSASGTSITLSNTHSTGKTNVLINDGNLTVDSPTFFVDNANHMVGVGSITPTEDLYVSGDVNITENLSVSGNVYIGNLSTTTATLPVQYSLAVSAPVNAQIGRGAIYGSTGDTGVYGALGLQSLINDYGVYGGEFTDNTDTFAGYFLGDVYVSDSLEVADGIYEASGNITGANGEYINIGSTNGNIALKTNSDANDYIYWDLDTNSYPETRCILNGGNTLCEFPTGIFSTGSAYFQTSTHVRGVVANDIASVAGGAIYLNDNVSITGNLTLGGTGSQSRIEQGTGFLGDFTQLILDEDNDGQGYFQIINKTGGQSLFIVWQLGSVSISNTISAGGAGLANYNSFGTGAPEQAAIDSKDDVYISGDLEVDGTAYLNSYVSPGDIAETLNTIASRNNTLCQGNVSCLSETTDDDLHFGDLVCINPTESQTIEKCREGNSRLAVGVISNTTVLSMGITSGYPVAVAGIVFVHMDASVDPIYPGDLLVSSEKDGYVAKNNTPGDGTVVGKAFDFCLEEECTVPMFVALS